MIEFVSILLALAVGPIEVEVAVDETVVSVVLELDGEEVAVLSGPPWKTEIDLGDRLRPRRLTARALDTEGREMDRATRQLNVYRPPSEVDYVLHRNKSGWVTMISLSWAPRAGVRARRSAVSVDGRPVDFEDPTQIYPPPLDPERLHIVEAVVEYSDGVVARDLIGMGGPVLGDGSARLTAIPVEAGDAAVEPTTETVSARSTGGEPVRVVGVEPGDAEIVFVRDVEAASAVERIGPGGADMGALSGARDAQAARVIHSVPLASDEWVRVLDPGAVVRRGSSLDQHRIAVPLVNDREGDFGLFWHLKTHESADSERTGAWLSDAVAIAGSRAAFGGRRRATVLLLAADSADGGSLVDVDGARGYLAAQRVPLYVWYLGKPAKAPQNWGPTVAVRSIPALEQALDSLRASLSRQRIAWVEGVHLPGEIEVEISPR